MTERTPARDILKMAVVGSLTGVAVIIMGMVMLEIASDNSSEMRWALGNILLLAGLAGLALALVLSTPVSFLVGLLLGGMGPIGRVKAVLIGLISGPISVSIFLVFAITRWRDLDATMLLLLPLFALVGALSGLVAHRLVLGESPTELVA